MARAFKAAAAAAVFALTSLAFAQSQSPVGTRKTLPLTGVNFAGAEFADNQLPGIYGKHYTYPENSSIDYFAAKGMNIVRLAVLWERLQRSLGAELDEDEMRRIDAVVNYATSKGMKTIIDIHNYAKYANAAIGTKRTPRDTLGNLWRRIALRYKGNASVIFGLMNEPTGLPTNTWREAANIAIAKIREAGADNLILVPGNGWSSARDWMSTKYGIPNSQEMLKIVDPGKNYIFEVHQYFDRDFTGTHAECQSVDIGVASLAPFTQWARTHRKRAFLGEFGAGTSLTCLEALDRVLKFLAANGDVWIGWTYWAAGTWWDKDYYTNIEPIEGQDRPQMSVLEKYLANAKSR